LKGLCEVVCAYECGSKNVGVLFFFSHVSFFFSLSLMLCSDFNRILDKYTRFFDFRYDVKNSLDGSSISLEDLLDISTTSSSVDIGV
jgi:hypothetical protein